MKYTMYIYNQKILINEQQVFNVAKIKGMAEKILRKGIKSYSISTMEMEIQNMINRIKLNPNNVLEAEIMYDDKAISEYAKEQIIKNSKII